MKPKTRKGRLTWILTIVVTLLLFTLLVWAATEKLYATSQSCTPAADCTVANGGNTLGPPDGNTGSATGEYAQRNINWNFTMNNSQSPGTFVNANITLYNFNLSWTATGNSDDINLEYCINGTCTNLDTFTATNATQPVKNLTYPASQIQSFGNATNTTIRFIGGTKRQGPDAMTVILDAISIDINYTPPSITAFSALSNNSIFNFESTNFEANCSCTGNYQCEEVFVKVQDNRTGSFTDSTTISTADVYVNTTSYNLGTIVAGNTVSSNFNITSNTPGNYSFRAVCNSTNALGSPNASAPDTLEVKPNLYEVGILSPNTTFPVGINAGDNISINFNFTKNGEAITSSIQVVNMTVDNLLCQEIPGLEYQAANGYWEVNCTTNKSLTRGLKDLEIFANYTVDSGIGNDTSIQSVNVTPLVSPNITSIVVDEGDVMGEINLLAGRRVDVWCNSTVFDENGASDISGANATFFFTDNQSTDPDDLNSHYTNTSCSTLGSSGNYKNFTCGFSVVHYAVNGTWHCNTTVIDDNQFSDSRQNNTLVNPLFAINITKNIIDYQEVPINQSSGDVTVNVSNIGNQPINVSVKGYGGNDSTTGNGLALVCQNNNITIDNERFAVSSGIPFTSKTPLSSSYQQMGFTLEKQIDSQEIINDTYWQMFVPNLNPPLGRGLCNGTIIFQAEQS